MTRTERRQGGFAAEQSAVRYEKNYLSLYTDISADVYRLGGAVGSVYKMPCSSVGRARSLVGFVLHTGGGRRFESAHGNEFLSMRILMIGSAVCPQVSATGQN